MVVWYGLSQGIRDNILKEVANNIQAFTFDDANTIQLLATKQGDLFARLAAIRIKAMAKFYKILTPEQKAKAEELHGQLEGLFGGGPGRFGS